MAQPQRPARDSITTPRPAADPAATLRALARLMDSAIAIPGTNIRLGLDSVIGLVPGVGDLAGAAMSGYIVLASARLGAPAPVLIRMVANVAVDGIVGSVPLLGDLFDVGYRANIRNTDLLDRHLAEPRAAKRSSVAVVAGIAFLLVLIAVGAIALTVAVLKGLASLLGG
jgi:hypothetical protein